MEGPDVGYAWLVALAACMMNFIMAGLGRLSGILFVAFMEIFQVDRKGASLPLSVRSSARNLFGPVVGILGQKYGPRKMMIIGGIIGTISAALCFFAPNILWITILWGAVNGMSTAMSVTLSQVVIGQYFQKHRTTAAGLGFSGGCVGSFMFPVLLEYFLQNYGLQGTFFIIASVIAHVLPAAMILRKPSWLKERVQKSVPTVSQSLDNLVRDENEGAPNVNIQSVEKCAPKELLPESSEVKSRTTDSLCEAEKSPNGNRCAPEKNFHDVLNLDAHPDIQFLKDNNGILTKMFSLMKSKTRENVHLEVDPLDFNIMEEIEHLYNFHLYSRGKFQFNTTLKHSKNEFLEVEFRNDSTLVCNNINRSFNLRKKIPDPELPKMNSVPDIAKACDDSKAIILKHLLERVCKDEKWLLENFQEDKYKATLVIAELQKLLNAIQIGKNINLSGETTNCVGKSGDEIKNESHSNSLAVHIVTAFKLYANPLFLMVCLCRAVHFITFVTAMTTVVDFSIDKGLQKYDGKYVIAAISFGDLVGRLCLGWITDRGFINLPKYMMIFMVIQGVCTATLPMMHSEIPIYTALAVFGMLQGSLFVRHPVLISRYLGSHEQSIAMGCANLFSGLLGFALPAYIGYFRDVVGSYDYIYYLNGLIGAFVGLIWTFEPFFIRCVNARKTRRNIPV